MFAAEEMAVLKAALLRGLRANLTPDQGYEAFERHQLLAIRFHRAARLNAPEVGEGAGWRRYFAEHFPRGDEHAGLLWDKWRNTLLKDEKPGSGVILAHGQPILHWNVYPDRGLCVNLESMQADFEESVDSFISLLERDDDRRLATLVAWRARQWTVERVVFITGNIASVAAVSATAMTRRDTPPKSQ